jgi:hypothetical protein
MLVNNISTNVSASPEKNGFISLPQSQNKNINNMCIVGNPVRMICEHFLEVKNPAPGWLCVMLIIYFLITWLVHEWKLTPHRYFTWPVAYLIWVLSSVYQYPESLSHGFVVSFIGSHQLSSFHQLQLPHHKNPMRERVIWLFSLGWQLPSVLIWLSRVVFQLLLEHPPKM